MKDKELKEVIDNRIDIRLGEIFITLWGYLFFFGVVFILGFVFGRF